VPSQEGRFAPAADDDDDDDEPAVFDLRELYGDDYDPDAPFDDDDEEEEEVVDDDDDEDDDDDDDDVRLLPPVRASLLSGDPPGHRSGYVAIVGRPNAGKSTFMNALVGTKLSIVTYKPQTTRHRILGLVSEDDFQMVLLDTPGVMREEFNKLDEMMLKSVRNAMANADVLLAIVDARRDPLGNFEGLLPERRPGDDPAPLGIIINKCDLLGVDEIRRVLSHTGSHATASARCTSILKEFSRCISPPTPWFQSRRASTPFNFASDAFQLHPISSLVWNDPQTAEENVRVVPGRGAGVSGQRARGRRARRGAKVGGVEAPGGADAVPEGRDIRAPGAVLHRGDHSRENFLTVREGGAVQRAGVGVFA
jgi:small GTP-binding protein